MACNKENIRLKPTKNTSKTRIPVPMEPLPLIPHHLLNKTATQLRAPLKTIDFSNINVASTSQVQKAQAEMKVHKKNTLEKCGRVITYSKIKKEWAQKVFEDNHVSTPVSYDSVKTEPKETGAASRGNNFVKSVPEDVILLADVQSDRMFKSQCHHNMAFILSDDDSDKNETVRCIEDEQKNTLHAVQSDSLVVTPASLIEHRGVRNIKKSLKRPHSRELQGLSPTVQNKTVEGKVKRCLMFDRLEDSMLSSNVWRASYKTELSREITNDIFSHLLYVESKPRGDPKIPSKTRACVINWLLKINGPDGNPAVIQSACWYLDSYLSLKLVPLVDLQVVAAACYWIAQKLHGPMLTATMMVLCGNNAFTAENLRATEIMVLRKLGFPRQPVVPQEFITYLSCWCGQSHSGEVEEAASFLCMAGLMVNKRLCEELPSVIAAAAVKNAILYLGKDHLMNRLIMCPVYQSCMTKFSNRPTAAILRMAVSAISCPKYEYSILLEHYRHPPYHVAQKIVEAANKN